MSGRTALALTVILSFTATPLAGEACAQEPRKLVGAEADTIGLPDSAGRVVTVYAIQVGAFSEFENAEKLAGLLRVNGFGAVIYDNLLDGKHLLHLVWVGGFTSREDAFPAIAAIEKLTGIRGVLREQMIWKRW